MWTDETRRRHDRSGLRYTHDLTDEEWTQVEPLMPPAKRGGNKRTVDIREIVNGLMYILGSGCQWRDIPKDLPPKSTIHDYLDRWSYDGTLDNIHHSLYMKCREQDGRQASPTAALTTPLIFTPHRKYRRTAGLQRSLPRSARATVSAAGLAWWG